MQGGHQTDPAIRALKELRDAYRDLLEQPSEGTVRACRHAHSREIECLSHGDISRQVDALLEYVRDSDQGTVNFALENLVRAEDWVWEVERQLAAELGFNSRQAAAMIDRAKRGLQSAQSRKVDVDGLSDTQVLVDLLEAIHEPTIQTAENTRKTREGDVVVRKLPWKRKRPVKAAARERVDSQLFLVGSIVANSKKESVFPHSYAISLGLVAAGHR